MELTRCVTDSITLPLPRVEVFGFFSDPRNLERLTPPWLSFRILTVDPLPVGEGAVYDYSLRLRGLRLRWRTLITVWEEGHRFQDLQVRGPYALWRHTHTFEDSSDGGTRMTDEVHYRLPFGLLGGVALPFVKRDVEKIFTFRREALEGMAAEGFGTGAKVLRP
jgi:ligand-binding SRPBCC domain-containing protein